MPNKVIVTGASGFVGSHCLPLLVERGFEVHAISRNTLKENDSTRHVVSHRIDLFDHEQVKRLMEELKPSHLLHCAWIATPGVFWNSQENLAWLEATIVLMQAFGSAGGKRALSLGTCAEYDWQTPGVYSETAPLNPSTLYGHCKVAALHALQAAAHIYGFNWAWGRLFFPYGRGEPINKFISSVILAIKQAKHLECTDGLQVRDFLYISDVANALVTLLMSDKTGACNIASGVPISLREILRAVTDEMGGSEWIKWGVKPSNEPSVIVANTAVLKECLKWQPHISLTQGIQDLIESLTLPTEVGAESKSYS